MQHFAYFEPVDTYRRKQSGPIAGYVICHTCGLRERYPSMKEGAAAVRKHERDTRP